MTALSLLVVAILTIVGLPIETGVLFVTTAFSLVYVVATAATVRLLPRGTAVWFGALLSVAGTAVLTLLGGWRLVPTVVVATLALAYVSRRAR